MSFAPSGFAVPASPPAQPPRRGHYWLLGALIVVLAGLTAALLLLDPWLKSKLERQVATQSQGRYRLRIGTLRTHLFTGSAELTGLRLRPVKDPNRWTDTTRLPRLLADVGALRLRGLGLWTALRGGVVPLDSLVLADLRLRVLHLPPARPGAPPLHARLPARLAGLAIGYLGLQNLQAAYGPGRRPEASLRRADLAAHNLLLTAAGAADTTRLGYAKAVQGRVQGLAARALLQHAVALARADFSTRAGRLTLDSLRTTALLPQGRRGRLPRLNLTLRQLRLTGFTTAQLACRRLRLDSVRVTAPHLTFTPPQQPPPPIYQLVAPVLRQLTVAHARLTGGWLRVRGINSAPTLRGITLTGTGLAVSKKAAFDPGRVFYAAAWQLHTGSATARFSTPVYRGGYRSLDLDTRRGGLLVQDVFILPNLSATAVNRLKHHQAPNLTVHAPRVQATGFDYAALEQHGALLARQLTLRGLRVIIDGDGNFPLNPRPSIVTPERLGTLPLRLNLRRLVIAGARVRSNYLSPSSGRWGTIAFDRLNGTLTNVTNDPRLMSAAHPAVATASGYVANRWRADLKIWLPLLDPAGRHWGQATFGPGAISLLNSMTEPSRNVRFAQGQVRQATIRFRADRRQITGTMRAEYADLKLTLLSKKGGADHKTIFTKIGTSLLNGLVVRDNNPRRAGGKLKVGEMTSRRDRRVSVFSLWRQGLVSGLLHSIGAPQKLAQKISEQE